ncbi:5'-Nucleotidase/apyrase [Kipferlia bialata]|uniref:5'-Nucleotidase/apyrase n=1 Tax=Kipferlia bialata TaxID=797122 RepID=A0A9K3GMX1_9EUKA|nr:5'-Nucleotidase/apyrase [Kipferlia bialata]|eukprot:g10892.t1
MRSKMLFSLSLLAIFVGVALCVDEDTVLKLTVLHHSDMHGWLYGHKHESNYNADYGDYQALLNHVDDYFTTEADTTLEDYLVYDSGDFLQGTGLSDATSPPGIDIIEVMNMVDFDGTTIGNHELGLPESVDYLWDKIHNEGYLPSFVTSNTDYVNTDFVDEPETFAKKYTCGQTTNTGHKFMTVGFMYYKETQHDFGNTIVTDPLVSVGQPWLQAAIDECEPEFVIATCHISYQDQDVFTGIKAAITAITGDIPTVFLTGHTHWWTAGNCDTGEVDEDGVEIEDPNCVYAEPGAYYRYIGRVELELARDADSGNMYIQQWSHPR